jgi:hypothetical protein
MLSRGPTDHEGGETSMAVKKHKCKKGFKYSKKHKKCVKSKKK